MCAALKEHREVIDYTFVLFALVWLGSAVSWNHQGCNECKTLGQLWL